MGETKREPNSTGNNQPKRDANDVRSRRLPSFQGDRGKEKRKDAHEIILPNLPGVVSAQLDWLIDIIDGDPKKLRVIEFIAKLEAIRIIRFVNKFYVDQDAETILERMSNLSDLELMEKIHDYVTITEATKIDEELRKKTEESREKVTAVLKMDEVSIEKVPHKILNLLDKDEVDAVEKAKIIQEVFDLIQKYSYENMDADDRMSIGCIYHVSESIEELQSHIEKAVLFPVLRRTDTGKIIGFVQVEKGVRVAKLNKTRKIRHKTNGKLESILQTPEEKILHEQLIVIDQDERFENKTIKGAGRKMLNWCFSMARSRHVSLMTTEVQTGNGASELFHRNMGYKRVGEIEERPKRIEPVHFNIFVYDLNVEPVQGDAPKKNSSSTPTAV